MNNEQFNYTYTAPTEEERKEISSIRRQYAPQEKAENKLDRLRKLNGWVVNTSNAVGIIVGVVGCLIFGLGLTFILEWSSLVIGIIISVIGGIIMGVTYPIYLLVNKRLKDKFGQEILSLTDELLGKDEKSE